MSRWRRPSFAVGDLVCDAWLNVLQVMYVSSGPWRRRRMTLSTPHRALNIVRLSPGSENFINIRVCLGAMTPVYRTFFGAYVERPPPCIPAGLHRYLFRHRSSSIFGQVIHGGSAVGRRLRP